MKKAMLAFTAVVAVVVSFAETPAAAPAVATTVAGTEVGTISIADARGKIGAAIADPKLLTETIRQLSAVDQRTFVAEVNAAIESMPGSTEAKAAASLNANSAAMKGRRKGNLMALLAEVFATASPEALTIINERFAVDLFNRAADGTTPYSDAEFSNIAATTMATVNARVADTDQPDVRSTFALLMFLRASNGTPKDLVDRLVETLPADSRETAKSEWIPAAMGTSADAADSTSGTTSSYESMLAASDAGRRPDYDFTLQVAGPQYFEALLGDLLGKSTDGKTFSNVQTPVTDAVQSPINVIRPDIGTGEARDNPEAAQYRIGIEPGREPGGYQWQTTYW